MAVVTPFRASHLDGIAALPQAHSFAEHPSETLWDLQGRVIACYGCVLASPGRGVLWLVPGPGAQAHHVALVRQLLTSLCRVMRDYGLWRVEMVVNASNRAAVDLIEYCGFTCEARLYGYGPEGQPFDQYAWIREKERAHGR